MTTPRFVAMPGANVPAHARASGYDTRIDAERSAAMFNDGVGLMAFVDDFHDGVFGDPSARWPWAVVDTRWPN